MNKISKPAFMPLFTLLAGLAGFFLRLWLFRTGIDDKGLLTADHPASTLVWVLTAITLPVLALCVRPLAPDTKYSQLFPANMWAGLGCILAAAGILYVNLRDLLLRQDAITVVTLILGLVAAAGLLILGYCRWQGKRPSFWLQSAVTVYFMLHLVSQYRLWSSEPQLQVYFFPLLASVFLMVTAYHGAVLDAQKKGNRRWYVFSNQAALFFCCLSLQGISWPFYLAMALWLATNLCSLKPQAALPAQNEEA